MNAGTNRMKISTVLLFVTVFALIALAVPPATAADAPTVTITDYTVNPSVLMPDGLGTVTVTVKNTASSASVSERSGELSADTYAVIKTTDVGVNIENVRLEGNGITVLSDDFARVGVIGPGQSLTFTFSFRAPQASGIYYPQVCIDTKGGTSMKYPVPVNVNTALGIQKNAILIMDSSLTGSQNPGDEIPVRVTVMNAGEMLADDVTIRVENVSATVAPKSTDLFHLGSIPAGGQKTVDLILISDKKTPAGLVRIPATIRYNAMDGTPTTQL